MLTRVRVSCALLLGAVLGSSPAVAQTLGCTGGGGGGPIPVTGSGGGGAFPGTLPSSPSSFTLAVASLPPGATVVTEVRLIGLTHTYVADLQFVLSDPSGAKHNVAGRAANFSCDYSGNYTFVPSCTGGAALPTSCNGTAVLAPGTYDQHSGTGPLAWPSGTNSILNTRLDAIAAATGTWTLTGYDWAGGDIGVLTGWELCFGNPVPPTPPAAPPTLGTPTDLSTVTNPVTLTWNAVACATTYDVNLDGSVTTGITATSFAAPVLAPGVHTWTARAVNASGATAYATSRSFTMPSPPPPSSCASGGGGGPVPASGTGGTGAVWPGTLPATPFSNTYAVTVPAGSTQIVKVDFTFSTQHTWYGDLHMVLTDPTGGMHNLLHRVGSTGGGNGSNCDLNGAYSLYETAGLSWPTTCPASTDVPNGDYNQSFGVWPNGTNGIFNTPLSAIPVASGNWTLTIYDWEAGDSGVLASWQLCFSQPFRCTTTYTTGADFDRGFRVNLLNPNLGNSYLRLSPQPEPIPLVWVACSARNTVVRIDAYTGEVLGEYYSRPAGMAGNPSRTTVDKYGNVWVGNRDEASVVGGVPKGSVVCIGVVLGGTRGNKLPGDVFVPNPTGQYLQGPFIYSTASDKDGDGLIRTSRGLCDVLPWTNSGGADTNANGPPSTAEDECIRFFTRVAGTNVRTMAVDANNDVWTGGLGNQAHQKVNGSFGFAVGGTTFDVNAGGYGGLIDCAGRLWSAKGNCHTPSSTGVLVYDPTSGSMVNLGIALGSYGLGIDPRTGNVWCTSVGWPGTSCPPSTYPSVVYKIDASPAIPVSLGSFAYGSENAQGCAVDASDNVWIAHSIVDPDGGGPLPVPSTVGRVQASTGAHVGNVALTTNGLTFGSGPTGVAIDTNQKVWVTCLNTSDVFRIDPNDTSSKSWSTAAGTVDLRVNLNAVSCGNAGPYNYSDMTGYVVLGSTSPSGFWTVVKDSLQDNTSWGTLTYIGSLMAGTGMKIEVRAANLESLLPTMPWIDKSNGGSFSACGRYLEIRVSMWRDPCSDPNATPILDSLTVTCLPGECPRTYCTPGTSTLGCVPYMGDLLFAQPSVTDSTAGNDFYIRCNGIEGNRAGVIFYGIDQGGFTPTSWGTGSSFLCVKAPTQRTLPQNSGGTSGACDGSFVIEWYDYQLANLGALGNPWTAGNKVYLQAWYRDPAAPKTTNLSNALELTYQP